MNLKEAFARLRVKLRYSSKRKKEYFNGGREAWIEELRHNLKVLEQAGVVR